jgi:hypothetical protein
LRTPFGPHLRKIFKDSRGDYRRAQAAAKKQQQPRRASTTLRFARAAARRTVNYLKLFDGNRSA